MTKLRSKAHIEKKKQKRKKYLFALPLILAVIVGIFAWYAWSPRFHVEAVVVGGTSLVEKEAVEQYVNTFLKSTLWGFVPKRSPYLIGPGALEEGLESYFPAILKAEVTISEKTLNVSIKERHATHIACADLGACYYMDESGFLFSSAPQFEGSSYVQFQSPLTDLKVGMHLVTESELRTIEKEIQIFKNVELPVREIVLVSPTEMNIVTNDNTIFIVRRLDSADDVGRRLNVLRKSRDGKIRGVFFYVDLRIESKIFFKEKSGQENKEI